MKTPKVTVLMPVFNGEKYLKEAIDSILDQDFTDFEFIIINDGSIDSSENIISSYTDVRIRYVDNGQNVGLVNTLNNGLTLASGEYIARMDCDDISVKTRLSKQVTLMDANRDIGACGSFYRILRNGKKAIVDFPLTNEEIKCYLLFNSPIAHPSAMIRTSLIRKYNLKYAPEFTHAEDYNLWSQISEYAQLANTSELLLNYRVHANQITGNPKFISVKNESLNVIRSRHLKMHGIDFNEDELAIHSLISNGEKPLNIEQLKSAERWLKKVLDTNNKSKHLNNSFLGKIILERWLRLCFNFFGGKNGFRYFYRSEIYRTIKLPFSRKIELFKQIYYSNKRRD